jgi:hypothetical protein
MVCGDTALSCDASSGAMTENPTPCFERPPSWRDCATVLAPPWVEERGMKHVDLCRGVDADAVSCMDYAIESAPRGYQMWSHRRQSSSYSQSCNPR